MAPGSAKKRASHAERLRKKREVELVRYRRIKTDRVAREEQKKRTILNISGRRHDTCHTSRTAVPHCLLPKRGRYENCVLLADIRPGTYVVVKCDGNIDDRTMYRTAAVCRGEVEEDGEVQVVVLRLDADDGINFPMAESDVSYVEFDDILCILPVPHVLLRRNRVLYNFPRPIPVYERP